jgi:hypothetical protein
MLRRLIAASLRLLIGTLEWFHARTVGPIVDWLDESVLAASEESVKLFVREFFTSAKRLINGFCAHLLGMFDAQYRESLKLTWQQKEAWHSWWREERSSTLNAVLAQSPEAAADTGQSRPKHNVQYVVGGHPEHATFAAVFACSSRRCWCLFQFPTWQFENGQPMLSSTAFKLGPVHHTCCFSLTTC